MTTRRRAMWVGLLSLFASACTLDRGLRVPEPDPVEFESTVYPILLADCGFVACHGDTRRPFAVLGPGRTRLSPESAPYDPVTPEELALTYARASAMLVDPGGPRAAPLLRKPLAVAAGGAGHRGDDPWGAAVYATKRDPRWEALFFWAVGAEEAP